MALTLTGIYNKLTWKNSPDHTTPINAENLNHIETGIKNNNTGLRVAEAAINQNAEDIEQINTNLTELIGSQIDAGTKTVSVSSNKNKILCIVKKSNVIAQSKVIPLSVLSANDVIPLGETAPIVPTTESFDTFTTDSNNINIYWTFQTKYGDTLKESVGGSSGSGGTVSNTKWATDLSNALGAKITYNGNNSFTITSITGLSVYLYA